MQILDGNKVKEKLLQDIKHEIEDLFLKHKQRPGLAVILVGDNPASQVYVSMKQKACASIGIESFEHVLPTKTSAEELRTLIGSLNESPDVHGILLQLPLPDHLNADDMIQAIDPRKDVDGLHPTNMGKVLQGLDAFRSCTPFGVLKLLDFYDVETEGKHVVILGRSNLVGKPLAAMLVQKAQPGNATVTVCHSRSHNLYDITRTADILICAIGKPEFVSKIMVKPGATVIDVGINRIDTPETHKGYQLVGDVDYESVSQIAGAITPVPGGVGPLTIAMLMHNTLQGFKSRL